MNIGKSITPIMPPKVETDKAFPRLLPKYLAIVVSPACPIAPCPKKRKLNIINKRKNTCSIKKNIAKHDKNIPIDISKE